MIFHVSSEVAGIVILLVVLTSPMTSGCRCPSCHYLDPNENCQCCVYRQLGKRNGPALTYDTLAPFSMAVAPGSALQHAASLRVPNRKHVTPNEWPAQLYGRGDYFDAIYDVKKGKTSKAGVREDAGMVARITNSLKLASGLEGNQEMPPPRHAHLYDYGN